MPTSEIISWSNEKLEPAMYPECARTMAVKLAASLDLAKGTILAEQVGTNELQKLVITGGPTGGSFTATFGGQTTAAINHNATADEIRDALEALSTIGDGNVRVTGGPLPGAPVFIEFVGALGGANRDQLTTTDSLTGGSTPATAVSTLRAGAAASPGTWKAYDNDNTDGSGEARAILPYDVQTDSNGLVTFSDTTSQVGGEHGQQHRSVPVYISGYFHTEDLVGLDMRAVAQLGRLVEGTLSDGIIRVE